jgi:hypothetical protein
MTSPKLTGRASYKHSRRFVMTLKPTSMRCARSRYSRLSIVAGRLLVIVMGGSGKSLCGSLSPRMRRFPAGGSGSADASAGSPTASFYSFMCICPAPKKRRFLLGFIGRCARRPVKDDPQQRWPGRHVSASPLISDSNV